MADVSYWARRQASPEQIQTWVEQFHRDGFLFLENVLPPDMVTELKHDLDAALADREDNGSGVIDLHCRMFETSPANLRLFDMEPIVTFAETLVDKNCHVVHNNSFRTPIGKGIVTWHQDDPPHYLVMHGEPPTNVRLPVLLFSCNYYLTDVTTVAHGPFQAMPGS
ncbi:MAG TPA: phytanoyl-CoA dioxygenase family protein, partial [Chthonomonadaceae bacterium]|nr:phytanoyl-CoA dioxygenase family protein [Chthonomonadaceae bacterium]